MALDEDEVLLLRVKWVESLETWRLSSTKRGRRVMMQAHRMARAGSIWDLWGLWFSVLL